MIDAAIRLVETEGPDALGVSRVARELGIKPPSIYNHVGKGDALALAVSIEGYRRLLATLQGHAAPMFDPRKQLGMLAYQTRAWALAHPHLYTVMSRTEPANEHPEFRPLLTAMLELFGHPLEALGVQQGDTVHAIRGLRAAVHGFLLLENSGQYALNASVDASFDWLVSTLLDGIR